MSYVFRHHFATPMLESGKDLRTMQALLRHANGETTEIYAHVAIGVGATGERSPFALKAGQCIQG